MPGGTWILSEPRNDARQIGQVQGGEAVIPLRKQTNGEGEWLQTEQGWVNSKTLFTPACQQGLNLATQRRWLATYAGVLVQVALADLLREQNDLEVAAQHLTESIDRAIQNQQPGLMMGYITLARVRQAQGNWQAAWDAIHAAKQCQPWLWSTILSVEACQVRLHLAQGNLENAP